ncbi:MAG: hypothetical protein DRI73_06415 [Bacteroidetes bacterium]|nr:MAG: hypothetical protein DRI73_06415 [Bacteroidota bacterium]
MLNLMSKDPGNWKGPFYFNRKDPRLIVPKYHSSFGWTLNFSNPYTYISLIAILLIIIGAGYFL